MAPDKRVAQPETGETPVRRPEGLLDGGEVPRDIVDLSRAEGDQTRRRDGENRAKAGRSGPTRGQRWKRALPFSAEDSPLWFPDAHRLNTAVLCLVVLVSATYVVPGLSAFRPWRADEGYLPFWNLLGREFLGEGARLESEAQTMAKLERRAKALQNSGMVAADRAPTVAEDPPLGTTPAEAGTGGLEPEHRPGQSSEPTVAAVYPPYIAHPADPVQPEVAVEFAGRLETFFERLTLSDLQRAPFVTRVSHWGDSALGTDGITGAIRSAFQRRFGDAGHGFHAMSQYDASYRHKGIEFSERGSWQRCYVIRRSLSCAPDRRYGYGGSTVHGRRGASSRFATAKRGGMGQSAGVFELWYQAHPNGGRIDLRLDGELYETVDSSSEVVADRWARLEVADGPHSFEVHAAGGGTARLYGVVLERNRPGVVWDSMALIGSFTNRMSFQDAEHLAGQVAHRDPALIAVTFGGNDMTREKSDLRHSMAPYEEDLGELLDLLRAGAPKAACLVMAPLDHGERKNGRIVSRPIVARMVQAQRRVAFAKGCAFFNTFAAMGGAGSIAHWVRHRPRWASPDLSHATFRGQKIIGEALLYPALMAGYIAHRRRMVGRPLPLAGDSTTVERPSHSQVASSGAAVEPAPQRVQSPARQPVEVVAPTKATRNSFSWVGPPIPKRLLRKQRRQRPETGSGERGR